MKDTAVWETRECLVNYVFRISRAQSRRKGLTETAQAFKCQIMLMLNFNVKELIFFPYRQWITTEDILARGLRDGRCLLDHSE